MSVIDEWMEYGTIIAKEIQSQHCAELFPQGLEDKMKEYDLWAKEHILLSLSRMLLTEDLEEYVKVHDEFYNSLDELERRLADKRFVFGDYITDSDIRLFAVLVRFDVEYSRYVEPCKKRIVDYPNIWGYLRDIYQVPAVSDAVDFEEFLSKNGKENDEGKNFYAGSVYYDFVLLQSDIPGLWSASPMREEKSSDPSNKLLIAR